jgi:hypothetical protein
MVFFQLLFTSYCFADINKLFKVNQFVAIIFSRKAWVVLGFVIKDPLLQIICYTSVEYCMPWVGQNVNVVDHCLYEADAEVTKMLLESFVGLSSYEMSSLAHRSGREGRPGPTRDPVEATWRRRYEKRSCDRHGVPGQISLFTL